MHALQKKASVITGALCAISILVSGCTTASPTIAVVQAPDDVAILSPELRHQLEGTGDAPPPLPGPAGSMPIRNCGEMIAAIRSTADFGERLERPEFASYSLCVAGTVARMGTRPTVVSFDLQSAGEEILARLDLASVPSSLAPRRPADKYFLADFLFRSKRVTPLSLELASDDFRYSFDVLASGDFRRRGRSELLVRFVDRAIGGNYNSTAILILGRRSDGKTIEAVSAVDFLRSQGPLRH